MDPKELHRRHDDSLNTENACNLAHNQQLTHWNDAIGCKTGYGWTYSWNCKLHWIEYVGCHTSYVSRLDDMTESKLTVLKDKNMFSKGERQNFKDTKRCLQNCTKISESDKNLTIRKLYSDVNSWLEIRFLRHACRKLAKIHWYAVYMRA